MLEGRSSQTFSYSLLHMYATFEVDGGSLSQMFMWNGGCPIISISSAGECDWFRVALRE